MIRVATVLFVCAVSAQTPAPRLDADLRAEKGHASVFVRMADQLFATGAAYEAFCAAQGDAPRGKVRATSLVALHDKNAVARRAMAEVAAELTKAGHLRNVRWFWIVNGFAADADATACERLAAAETVAFVHRQRQPGRPQQITAPRPAAFVDRGDAVLTKAWNEWRDDGDAPFSLEGVTVPWNLNAIGADAAWQTGALGKGVVVALCDSGLEPAPPLAAALWRNPREEKNGEDDDGDGRVDDLFGWDFEGDSPFVLGDPQQSHGSMCAGIVAARPAGEPLHLTGVAPRARLMILRGMGRLAAYEYAAEHGADVLSMSYMWVNVELGSYRGVFRTAHEHLAACGIVAVGGAGNFKQTAPAGRQITLPKDIPCVIAMAGVARDLTQAPFSSEGPCTWDGVPFFDDYPASAPLPKPDLCAPAMGFPVWHWTTSGRGNARAVWEGEGGFGLVVGPRGNSFAGPHAAGVAALVLGVNPGLTPWRVQALLAATARDLGPQRWDIAFGAGLLRADAAVAAARAAKVSD